MKKYIIVLILSLVICQALYSQNKITVDPLFKFGYYLNKKMKIYDPNTKWSSYHFNMDRNIDYNIHLGLRFKYKNFSVESENIFYIATDNFLSNYPYSTHFYIRGYYKWKRFKIGYEHLCIHPTVSNVELEYHIIGECDEIYISFNL